jgi:tetratricopeptide (TPR) repeat protein
MYRMMCAAAAVLIATVVQPAAADDRSVCEDADHAPDAAVAACTRILALDPRDAAAYTGRGNAYVRKGDRDHAISDYDQAIRVNPNYADAYTDRGNAYVLKGDYGRAISDYDQLIRLDPKNPKAYNHRGAAHRDKGSLTAGSPISTRRSGSIRNLLSPTTTAALPTSANSTTTSRLRITMRRSDSCRN